MCYHSQVKKSQKRLIKDLFIPHHGNKHTPHLISHGALFGYSVGLVLVKFFALAAAIALPAASLYSSAITPHNIISLTNSSRSSLELTPLTENVKLASSAQAKAEDMLANQYFAHTSPSGTTPWSWIKNSGYAYKYAGENLAVYYTQAEDVTAGWMASPTHRNNIVDTRYTDIGIGVAQGEFNGYPSIFVVQHFGKPATQPIIEAPQPPTEPTATQKIAVAPLKDAYVVSVANPTATAVTVQLGNKSIPLEKTVAGDWTGTVPVEPDSIPSSGQELMVVSAENDKQLVEAAAIVAPRSTTTDIYAFGNTAPKATIFGLKLGGLDDQVTKFYLIVITFLASLLLVSLFAKMHWERLPLAAHVLGVIGIAFILMSV